MRLLHGIIGIATEAGEMLEALRQGVEDGVFDLTNVAEEVGDNQWYAAAILRALKTNFESIQRTNIAKLRARFPNKFTEFDANNRNLQAERQILEGKPSKPVVRIKDWAIVYPEGRGILIGTVLDHPRAPGGGESEVRTPIVSFDVEKGLVETKNTIYQLVGDLA